MRQRIDAGGQVTAVKYLEGLQTRKRLLAAFEAAFQEVDAIVAPTVPIPAPLITDENVQIDGEKVGARLPWWA